MKKDATKAKEIQGITFEELDEGLEWYKDILAERIEDCESFCEDHVDEKHEELKDYINEHANEIYDFFQIMSGKLDKVEENISFETEDLRLYISDLEDKIIELESEIEGLKDSSDRNSE